MEEQKFTEIVIKVGQDAAFGEGLHPFFPVSVTVDGQELKRITEITVHAELGVIPTITYTQYAIP